MFWLAAALILFYVSVRCLAVATSGHLLFHIDQGEYALYDAILAFSDHSLGGLLSDPDLRRQFALSTVHVGDNAVHGTLILAGAGLHLLVHELGLPFSTWTLRGFGLGLSVMTLCLWWSVLRRSNGRSSRAPVFFLLLAILPTAVFFKVSLVCWGTHEWVVLLSALGLWSVLSWLEPPDRFGPALGRALAAGGLLALAMILNTSLLLPAAFFGLWLAVSWARDHWRVGQRRTAAMALVGLFLAEGLAMVLTWQLLLEIDALRSLGLDPRLWANDKLELIFQPDAVPRAHQSAAPLQGGATPRFYGPFTWLRSALPASASLVPYLLLAVGTLVFDRMPRSPARTLRRFLAAFLVFGWLAIAAAPFAYTGPDSDGRLLFVPRYATLLHPVAFALAALWASEGGKVRALVLVALAAVQAPTTLPFWDLGNLEASKRYDGVALFHVDMAEDAMTPPKERVPLGQRSPSFLRGYALVRSYQGINYWDWGRPLAVAAAKHEERFRHHRARFGGDRGAGMDWSEFDRGAGYALRVLVPPIRAKSLEALYGAHPDSAPALREGYQLPGWALEAEL